MINKVNNLFIMMDFVKLFLLDWLSFSHFLYFLDLSVIYPVGNYVFLKDTCLLLVCGNTIDFFILSLYLLILSKSLINSNNTSDILNFLHTQE